MLFLITYLYSILPHVEYHRFGIVGRLVVLDLTPFETVFQSISGRLPETEKEKRQM